MRKYQHRRPNPTKPAVTKDLGFWWARVWDLNNKFHSRLADSQSEALTKAYELAVLVEQQRHGSEATA